MFRPPASLIVIADSWLGAQASVDRLQSRLGARDEIIVAIADEFGVAANAHGSVRSITGAPETVAQDAAKAARNEIVVLLAPTIVATGHWLDALLAPFEADEVVATAPAIEHVPNAGALRELGQTWAKNHRGELTEVDELAKSCIAVRRDAFVAAGSVDETRGRKLHVRDALVGVIGSAAATAVKIERSGPLVSACLIVKNEAENLTRCLGSLGGLVDEVVVYDTGSTDDTVAVAKRSGATVLQGEWIDDFAASRNAALAACNGEWILWIDADEALLGDKSALRAVLEGDPSVDTIAVNIDNLDAAGKAVASTNQALKVFRRERAQWEGRLHEQIVPRNGQAELRPGYTAHIRMLHAGYAEDELAVKAKSERNIRIAEAELAEGTNRRGLVLINLGRSLASADRLNEALARFEEALEETDKVAERRLALRHGAEALLDTDQPEVALEWIERLRAASKETAMADYLEAIALADMGDETASLEKLLSLRDVHDEDGFAIPNHTLRLRRALLLRNASRWSEAADELFAIVDGDTVPPWSLLAEVHWRAGRNPDEVASVVGDKQLTSALGQLLAVTPEAADGILAALHQRWGDDAAVLAAASVIGAKLGVTRALEWSALLRRAGLDGQCPLLTIAKNEERGCAERVQAACVALGAFGDERAQAGIRSVAPVVPEGDLYDTLIQIGELAPALLPSFVMAAATDSDRTIALADALEALGADDVAADLRAHVLA